jgi:hypothetical protein
MVERIVGVVVSQANLLKFAAQASSRVFKRSSRTIVLIDVHVLGRRNGLE